MDVVFYIPEFKSIFSYDFNSNTKVEDVINHICNMYDLTFEEYYLLKIQIDSIEGCKYCLLEDDIKQSFLIIQDSEGLDDALSSLLDFIYYCEDSNDGTDYVKFFEDCSFNSPLHIATMLFCGSAKILPDVINKIDLLRHKDDYYCGQNTPREDIGIAVYIHECLEGMFTSEGYFFHE